MTTLMALSLRSRNTKTGPIPVTTTHAETCSDECGFKGRGCFAQGGHTAMFWQKVNDGRAGASLQTIAKAIAALKPGTLWRHNQAGDLPGRGDRINVGELRTLVRANAGKRGFTYTHKPVTGDNPHAARNAEAIAEANRDGFTINLSADNLQEADELAALDIGPVVVVLPQYQTEATTTPEGRRVAICPAALSDDVTCKTCGVCAMRDRKSIIGFPAHGVSKARATAVAEGRA